MTDPAADWQALQGTIAGGVILPGSPDYEPVRKPPGDFFSFRQSIPGHALVR